MGSGLGGPPNPQLQGRREEGRTWQSCKKGRGPTNDSTHHPQHTHTYTHIHTYRHTHNSPFSSPAAYKNSELLGVPRMFYVLQREKGVAQKWDRAW